MAAVCQWALAELEQASISERTCNKVIATCGRQIQWQRAIQVLFQMVEVRQATSISCNSCMAACSRASHWQKALHLMRCLRGFIRHDGVTYKQAARAAGESSWRSGLRLLQEGFEKMTEADVIHYDLALSLRQSAGSDHWPEALHLMKNMVEAQVQADVRSYSSSMTFEAAWPTIGLLFQDLLQRMEADEYTCNTAVSAAPWVRAWCLLQRRKEHGMSVVSHNAAMAGTPWFKAVQVLHTLETGGLKLTAVSSGTILSQSRDMEWQRPLWFLSRCQSMDIQSNSIVQSNVLAAHVDAGHWQETLGNVMAYHSRGGNLNVALKTLSLSAFSQAVSWQKALALSASERIDVVLLNALVTCCARVARWQEGLEVVCGSLVRHSLRASVVTFNAALSACAAGRQWQLAVNLIEEMEGQRLAPDSLTLNSMMLALGEAGLWQHAFEILKMFSSCSCEANVVSFTTAITACPAHQWPQSLVLVQQAASDAAGETSWAAAVTTLGRAVRWREAMCLGHIAMEGTHDAVMLAYATAVEKMSLEMRGCYQMLGGGSAQVTELRACKKELKELIETRNCHPILVRLAWHDSGTYDQRIKEWPQCGGANGAIRFDPEMNMGANAGLDKARGYLQTIHEAHPTVSWADLIQLASATAIEMAGGPVIKMKYGRVSVTGPEQCAGPQSRQGFKGNAGLPDAAPGADGTFGCGAKTPEEHLRNVFGKKMGFTDQDIVALSGAHTIGRVFKERSGACPFGYGEQAASKYTKGSCIVRKDKKSGCGMVGGAAWTQNWLTFDNSYYTDYKQAMDDDDLMWLPTDACLHEDPEFKKYFYKYAGDQAAFFQDYASAHKKLSELGCKFDPPAGFQI